MAYRSGTYIAFHTEESRKVDSANFGFVPPRTAARAAAK